MAITKTTQPYEFLVRWRDGAISGAHIRFLETILEDGVVLAQKEGNAMPVSLSGEVGYPLADVLTAVQQSALVELEKAKEALATAEASLAAVQEAPIVA